MTLLSQSSPSRMFFSVALREGGFSRLFDRRYHLFETNGVIDVELVVQEVEIVPLPLDELERGLVEASSCSFHRDKARILSSVCFMRRISGCIALQKRFWKAPALWFTSYSRSAQAETLKPLKASRLAGRTWPSSSSLWVKFDSSCTQTDACKRQKIGSARQGPGRGRRNSPQLNFSWGA